MPFDTPAGPAVLVENIVNTEELALRLGIHVNSVYNWYKNRERTKFPEALPCGLTHFDYAEVYDWFRGWVKAHPGNYPMAFIELITEGPA